MSNTSTAPLLAIDGSHGEGGGQVLRNAMSFATILKKNISISNIRTGRSKPGLKAQHMAGMKLCADMTATSSGATLTGCELNSTNITYSTSMPEALEQDEQLEFVGDTKTAGSICLILQAALPVALFARKIPTDLILKGGTNASFAPQFDYWEEVFLPTLVSKCGFPDDLIEHKVVRRGYFPKGGGEVKIEVEPWTEPLPPLLLTDRGEVSEISIRSYYAGNVPLRVATEMVESAKQVIKEAGIAIEPNVEIVHETQAVDSGCGIMLVATTTTGCRLAGSALGERKKQAAMVGKEAAEELVTTLKDGGCVDEWLQDQLILFMALANGTSEMLTGSLTLHTRTAIWLAEEVAGAKFEVTRLEEESKGTADEGYGKDGRIPGKHLIRCVGIGHTNKK
jgi:RNA 3'-terminal phosphate cyclase (ATP)